MKNYISAAADAVFYLSAGFILSFIFVNFYLPRPASYVLSATFAIIFTLLVVKLSLDKRRKTSSFKEAEKRFGEVMTALNLSGEKTLTDLFDKAFKAEGYSTEKKRGSVFIQEKNTTAFFRFGFDGVSKTEIVKCFNKIGKRQKAEIFAENFTDDVKTFAARFGGKVVLTDGKEVFALLNRHGLLPENFATIKEENTRAPIDFRRLLNKKRAKNYLVFGLIFTLLSYIAPIKGYYLAFGAAFISFALILKLFGKPATA